MSDDLQRIWQESDDDPGRTAPDFESVADIKRRAAAFDRAVRRRDWLEITAAAVVGAFFLPLLFDAAWVTRAGVVLFLAGAALIPIKLRRARGVKPDPAAPLGETLRAERAKVDAQIRLLESVLWWYLAPLGSGVVLIFIGNAGLSWASLVYTAVVVVAYGWIYRLNRRVARYELVPQRDEWNRLIERLEGEGS